MSDKYLDKIDDIIISSCTKFWQWASVTNRNYLKADWNYSMIEWYKIDDVVSVFVDIKNSTGLSAVSHQNTTANIYEFFTWTAIKIFHNMWAEYIDVKWDWVFALFSKNKVFTALVAAVTFKTFADDKFLPEVKKKLKWKVEIGYHMWIDQKTVLVKTVWLKDNSDRDSRKNEVWAWKPINMSAKLASLADNQLCISDRYFKNIKDEELVTHTCWCKNWVPNNEKEYLWEKEIDLSDDHKFDFDKAYVLETHWCSIHWKDWCKEILKLDN